jgi:hypothetical protein
MLLSTLRARLGLPIHVVRHLRNPWDNVSSIFHRPSFRQRRELPEIVDEYFRLLDAATTGIAAAGTDVRVTITRHEALVRDPKALMRGLLADLELDAPADYLEACAQFVHAAERRTRHAAPWTPALREAVAERARGVPLLAGYSFEG